jgi:mRNA interferase HigB
MHVITHKRLREFWQIHPDAKEPLMHWYETIENAHWRNMVELKQILPAADLVGRLMVFNISGNKYRLVARVEYRRQKVFIRHIMTHAEYDKGEWKNDPWF